MFEFNDDFDLNIGELSTPPDTEVLIDRQTGHSLIVRSRQIAEDVWVWEHNSEALEEETNALVAGLTL